MKFLSNAFSLNMIESPLVGDSYGIDVQRLSPEETTDLLETTYFKSVVGHADIAEVISNILGVEVPFNRESVKARKGDVLIIAQYSGPRLREGACMLPAGAQIDFYRVEIR